jgi:hypothetical protein
MTLQPFAWKIAHLHRGSRFPQGSGQRIRLSNPVVALDVDQQESRGFWRSGVKRRRKRALPRRIAPERLCISLLHHLRPVRHLDRRVIGRPFIGQDTTQVAKIKSSRAQIGRIGCDKMNEVARTKAIAFDEGP